jgi:hypothetical protein
MTEQVMATARDRKEYYKEWRQKNAEKVKKYLTDKYPDHAQHSANYREKHPERVLWSMAKRRAKEKKLKFSIDATEIKIPTTCPILDIPIVKVYTKGKKSGPTPNSPSIDRIDNTKGYIKRNVQVISHQANTMKANATPEELIKFAKWILRTYETVL